MFLPTFMHLLVWDSSIVYINIPDQRIRLSGYLAWFRILYKSWVFVCVRAGNDGYTLGALSLMAIRIGDPSPAKVENDTVAPFEKYIYIYTYLCVWHTYVTYLLYCVWGILIYYLYISMPHYINNKDLIKRYCKLKVIRIFRNMIMLYEDIFLINLEGI